jgi:hypothetical protein
MPLAFILVALATILLFIHLLKSAMFLPRAAFSVLLIALMVIPLAWSALTVTEGAGANLPAAYGVSGPGGRVQRPADAKTAALVPVKVAPQETAREELLAYLEANTQDVEYLVAVESSQVGASYVLATGRPVLYMGGFNGGDNVISAEDLAEMVASGELRFVLFGLDGRNKQDIAKWLRSSCAVVDEFSQHAPGNTQPGSNQGGQVLYDCR